MDTLFAGLIDIATLPIYIGIVLTLLDALRALVGWGGRRRWLTFGEDFWWSFGMLYLGALLVQLIPSLVFRSWTLSAYTVALAIMLVRAAAFVLAILLVDRIVRASVRLGQVIGRYGHSKASGETAAPAPAHPEVPTPTDTDTELDAILKTALQGALGADSPAHTHDARRSRLDDRLKDH